MIAAFLLSIPAFILVAISEMANRHQVPPSTTF
jgi:hypothetical protein